LGQNLKKTKKKKKFTNGWANTKKKGGRIAKTTALGTCRVAKKKKQKGNQHKVGHVRRIVKKSERGGEVITQKEKKKARTSRVCQARMV